ncbi:MAG: family 1 extracellular solute-binding protein [Paenibacillaceae bacterium]|nr:family 1 extracellular solute-binding protein [Paenibacillaceae bacterium]
MAQQATFASKTAKILAAATIALATAALAGCGNGKTAPNPDNNQGAAPGTPPQVSTEPVTLKVYFYQPGFSDEDFKGKFLPYLTKKFPNITYDLMMPQKGTKIEDIVASGDIPDLFEAGEKEVPNLSVLGVPLDLNSLIKQNQVDMNQFEPVLNSSLKKYSATGESLAMMFAEQYYATFYNKDIFDKFGVGYPTDGMTWDDLIALGKKLTREADGVQYMGIQAGNAAALAQKFGLDSANEKAKKALIDTEGWRRVFDLGKAMYTIPGNLPELDKFNVVSTIFTQDQNVAIAPYYGDSFINSLEKLQQQGKPMNWDMTSHPTFPDMPGKSHELSFRSFVISKTSKHKDQAFQVVSYIATSPETQMQLAKDAFGPAMKADTYKQQFGVNREVLKGKNVAAIFKTSPLDIHHINKYDSVVKKALDQPFYDFVSGKTDENTAIRTAQEAADKAIADMG